MKVVGKRPIAVIECDRQSGPDVAEELSSLIESSHFTVCTTPNFANTSAGGPS